jgi:hypothetical protein
MKQIILILFVVFTSFISFAQTPEDVLRFSYYPTNGSARNMAIGGAMTSLGGDINALFVNPAGLGLYKTREFVITPGLLFNKNELNFRGTPGNTNKNAFNLGTTGVVIGFNNPGSKWNSQAFSLGISTIANFNNTISYKGLNNYSSMAEVYASQLASSRQSLDDALNNPRFAFGTAPAIYTYLIDTFKNGNNEYEVKALPEFLLRQGMALQQEKTIRTTGGITELALGYAGNMNDQLYIGGSLGLSSVSYNRHTTYRESDTSSNKNNNFNYFEVNDDLSTTGFGLNARLGIIYKPKEYIRFGLAIHTPTLYHLTDKESSDLTADTEGYNGVSKVSSDIFTTDENSGQTPYLLYSPWRFMLSGSYVFREVNDTRKQRAFITGDVEYVTYPSSRFKPQGENKNNGEITYYNELKSVIKDYYKGAFNFRLGGELKFHTIMFRAGAAYYSNPYKDKNLKSDIFQLSGGLGYRNHGMFVDLTYVHNVTKDVNFPYRLDDKQNTFATQNTTRGNVVVSVGFKF